MKKPVVAPPRSCTIGPIEPYGKCGLMNHTTLEYRVRTNKCLWRGSIEHFIAAFPQRLKIPNVGAAKPPPPPRQGPVPSFDQRPPLQPLGDCTPILLRAPCHPCKEFMMFFMFLICVGMYPTMLSTMNLSTQGEFGICRRTRKILDRMEQTLRKRPFPLQKCSRSTIRLQTLLGNQNGSCKRST